MAGTVLDLENLIEPNLRARAIGRRYQEWQTYRDVWKEEKKELRDFIYATDTKTTSVGERLPWANSTTMPKLTQIYDNLKANYEAAMFPNSKWMKWDADNKADAQKAKAIQAYMYNKMKLGGFRLEANKLIDDYILFGNCFATVEWVNETREDGDNLNVGFTGPRIRRISPYDIVFNPVAGSFRDSPKIVRSIVSLGELREQGLYPEITKRIAENRREVAGSTSIEKSEGFIADGFSSIEHYYGSEYVELLTFYGTLNDEHTGEVLENMKIVVADRAYILEEEPIATWLGDAPIFHAGWRSRPDNLYAMGPLDNLVGMQYRIDHLENLKADVFDQIALPMLKIRGDVEDFEHAPGERIVLGEEGDVNYLAPETTALNADFQIQNIMNIMEEMAGAPRQAMGIRTPGEKTAFEVSSLENAAGRIFQHKAAKFEMEFVEPVLNAMIESARSNMDTSDAVTVLDDITGATIFQSVNKEDILAKGKIVPVGARHFAERAQRVQNINQMMQLKSMPDIGIHLSGKRIAELIAEELGEPELFEPNVGISEQMETQQLGQEAEADNLEQLQIAQEEGL